MEIKKDDSQAPVDKKVDDTTTDPKDVKPEEKGVDYKAEYDKLQSKLTKAEYTIEQLKKGPSKKQDDDSDDDDDKIDPLKLVDEKLSEFGKTIFATQRKTLINGMATNEDEAKLIEWYLDNRIKPSGDLAEDVATAKALANRKVIEKNFEVIKETLKEKNSFEGSGGSGSQPGKQKTEIALSNKDKKFMKSFGVSEDELS